MQYMTFGEKVDDVGKRLGKISKQKKLDISETERAALGALAKYVSDLPGVLKRGGTLGYREVRIVETLQKALDVIQKDGTLKGAEVKKLIEIAQDLEITDEEMKELEDTGENG